MKTLKKNRGKSIEGMTVKKVKNELYIFKFIISVKPSVGGYYIKAEQ